MPLHGCCRLTGCFGFWYWHSCLNCVVCLRSTAKGKYHTSSYFLWLNESHSVQRNLWTVQSRSLTSSLKLNSLLRSVVVHATRLSGMHKTGCSGETRLVLCAPSSSWARKPLTIISIIILIFRLHAGVLELIDFIRKENIKTLVEHIVDQHIERYTAVPLLLPSAAHISAWQAGSQKAAPIDTQQSRVCCICKQGKPAQACMLQAFLCIVCLALLLGCKKLRLAQDICCTLHFIHCAFGNQFSNCSTINTWQAVSDVAD